MSLKDKEKWNSKYQAPEYISGREPCEWLRENSELLTGQGKALDIATGEGRNAVYAASLGYDVLAVDISEVGIQKALALAKEKKTVIRTRIVDLDNYRLEGEGFDLIMCFNFLDRKLFPGIRKALKPGGLLFYETFTVDYLKYSGFKREWVLETNELLRAFQELRILRYREVDRDEKGFASLVACKIKH
ncbi:MAG: class I SAM-dependent methyltransferase [Nitrospinaceae bacterium]